MDRTMAHRPGEKGLYLMHLSVHGLIRGDRPELGRDPDTGGQVDYVVNLLRELGTHPQVRRVDLVTRQIFDPAISDDYRVAEEAVTPKAAIIRLPFGPRRYLRKERLWPYLPELVDAVLAYIQRQRMVPDVIHGHYADAGLVAVRVAKVLGIPVLFTGHSLGRYKQARVRAAGMSASRAEEAFRFAHRIEAEEEVLENAAQVIASTGTEIAEQYQLYDHYDVRRMKVLPPGCDLERFATRPPPAVVQGLAVELRRFLPDPARPPLIVLARADRQKNIAAALHVFGRSKLRQRANLVLFIGARDDLAALEPAQRAIYSEMLQLIDLYDLYGHVAYPKRHTPEGVAGLYHFAGRAGGLLLGFSRHENFGLTLVEAAAAGVPVVSSGAGGMREVIEACGHGVIVDPDATEAAAAAIDSLLSDPARLAAMSARGRRAARQLYRWGAHAGQYLAAVAEIKRANRLAAPRVIRPRRFVSARHVLVCDIDHTLTGDRRAIRTLNRIIAQRPDILFGVATGRSLEGAMRTLEAWQVTPPNFFISAVGTAIHYDLDISREDLRWQRQIAFRWMPERTLALVRQIPGLALQPDEAQGPFKISFQCDTPRASLVGEIKQVLRQNLVRARVVVSRGTSVDLIPVRASKGHALRYLLWKWRFDAASVVAAGDSGNDLDMMRGAVRGVVVGNHSGELEELRGSPNVYFASRPSSGGVIEGLIHHGVISRRAGRPLAAAPAGAVSG